MRIGVKPLIWSLPALAVLIVGVGIALGVAVAARALGLVDQVRETDYPMLDHVKSLGVDVQRLTEDLNGAVAEGEARKLDDAARRAVAIRGHIAAIGRLPGEAGLAHGLSRHFEAYYEPAVSVARIMLQLEQGDASARIGAMQEALHALNGGVDAATRRAQAAFAASLKATSDHIREVLWVIVIAAALAVAALVGVSHVIIRRIWRQLGGEPEYATRIVHAIARGDLTIPIEVAAGDLGSQLAALRTMQSSLGALIEDIRVAAASVGSSAGEIAVGMEQLAARTEEQASSLEQTAAGMEELTTTVAQNTQRATRAHELAGGSNEVAASGRDAVLQMVRTMDEIDTASGSMANIVSVIDGIAFQTNILALNAAVEAARAGEQGRGFAVVAAEVRALAHRSAASAREIRALITGSTAQVQSGRQRAAEAGVTLERVVAASDRVAAVVAEISHASVEQSSGIHQMGEAVARIEQVTQQNAALVEETAAAAQSMADQAVRLEKSVSVSRLAGEATAGIEPPGALPRLRLAPQAPSTMRKSRSAPSPSTRSASW